MLAEGTIPSIGGLSSSAAVAKGTRALYVAQGFRFRSRDRRRTSFPVCSGDKVEQKSVRKTKTQKGDSLPAALSGSASRFLSALLSLRPSPTTGAQHSSRKVRCDVLAEHHRRTNTTVPPPSVISLPHLDDVDLHMINMRSPHRLGLIVDPERDNLPFSFSVEILEPSHGTLMDVNPGFQLFYVLKGSGQAFCLDSEESQSVAFSVGDSLLFPPKTLHGITTEDTPVTLLGLMLHAPGIGHTAHEFVQWVRSAPTAGKLTKIELAALYKENKQLCDDTAASGAKKGMATLGGLWSTAARWAEGGKWRPLSQTPVASESTPASPDSTPAGPAAAVQTDEISDPREVVEHTESVTSHHGGHTTWPAHKKMSELQAKHLVGSEGVAGVPTNRLLLVFDSSTVPFLFALEVFDEGHETPLHAHPNGHELFYILQGEGEAFCDGYSWPVKAGDTAVFPVNSLHGINNTGPSKMCTLELMVPSEPEMLVAVEHTIEGMGVGVPVVPWDTTCMPDGRTGKMFCSEVGFSDAIQKGTPATQLSKEEMCGFAPKRC
mmetsp:Transcript_31889/g.53582  ORF Transcript_31889/g.53582 Transcript_31889/m.53582 type:complete len:547 (+) Transcript_31889:43-1683(+)